MISSGCLDCRTREPHTSVTVLSVSARPFMAEKRTYPAINVNRSGTRKEELLLKPEVLQKVWVLRKLLYPMDDLEATEFLVDKVKQTKNNAEFFDSMRRG